MNTNGDYPDKLRVKGLGPKLDGEYPCNLTGMLLESTPHTLTNREGHRVKVMSGVRAGELWESMTAGDNDVLLALAAIVLTRAGKNFDDEQLWDAPMGSGLEFEVADRVEEEADDEDPPATEESMPPEPSGGETSSNEMSDLPANDQSGTGTLDSSPSDHPTLEI